MRRQRWTIIFALAVILIGCQTPTGQPISEYVTPQIGTQPSVSYPEIISISAEPPKGAVPLCVSFEATIRGTATNFEWDFGDSTKSVDKAPSHTYQKNGRYSVSLTITGPGGRDHRQFQDLVAVSSTALSWQEAGRHIGETLSFHGPVASTRFLTTTKGQPTFMDIGRAFPASDRLALVIWGSDRPAFIKSFPPNPETYFLKKDVIVSGKVEEYPKGTGKPEIILQDPSQIRLAE